MPSITLAIPTHNRAELLGQTLEALRQVRVPPGATVELVVVADACTDATTEVARSGFQKLPFPCRLIVEEFRNLNRGRNACVEAARGEVVLFLDDDVWADPALIEGHLEVYETTSASIAAGSIELWWRDAVRPTWMSDGTAGLLTERKYSGAPKRLLRPWDAAGANFSIKRSVVRSVGGFKPGLDRSGTSLLGGGETDWIRRAMDKGMELWSAPNARVQHYVAPKRVESTSYVLGVARGLGSSHVYMKDRFPPTEIVRQLGGRSLILVRHAVRRVVAWGRKDPVASVDARCGMQLCLGALSATMTRIVGASPVPSELPTLDLDRVSAEPVKSNP